MKNPAALLAASLFLFSPGLRSELVRPTDERLAYLGRFDKLGTDEPVFSWSGTTIRFRLDARRAEVLLGGASVRYGLRINGADAAVWTGTEQSRSHVVEVPADRDLPVTIDIVRLNQPLFGISRFGGVELASARDLAPAPDHPARWIEFIGDSITAGHGNEASTKEAPLEAGTENFLKTYAALTADALQAQAVVQAWSGIRLTAGRPGDVTMPRRWGAAVPQDGASKWTYSITPDVVVINLGTNDFGENAPDEASWKKDYEAFLSEVRARYPEAWIFCTCGPMLSGDARAKLKQWTNALVQKLNDAGDPRLRTLYFATQRMEDGLGGQWHPGLRTHAIMARRLGAAIAEATGWTAAQIELPPVTQATQ